MNRYICIFCTFFLINSSIYADTSSDTNRLFDWAESTFSTIFSSHETTLSIQLPESANELAGSWLYRFYPEQSVYAGVLNGKDVYVLGGPWSQLLLVGTLNDLVANLPPVNTEDSGMCIDRLPHVAQGTQYNTLSANADGKSFTEYQATHEEVTSTFSRTKNIPISQSSGFISSEAINEYRRENGFLYISKVIVITQFDNRTDHLETSFSPELQSIISPICVGQTNIRDIVRTTNITTDGVAKPAITDRVLSTFVVEAINESKSVAAGTFNTVRSRDTATANGSYSLRWADIVTGIGIAVETYTENDILVSTVEVTSIIKP